MECPRANQLFAWRLATRVPRAGRQARSRPQARSNSSLAHRVGVTGGARCKPPPSETPKDLAGPRARCCASTGPSKSKAFLLPPSKGGSKAWRSSARAEASRVLKLVVGPACAAEAATERRKPGLRRDDGPQHATNVGASGGMDPRHKPEHDIWGAADRCPSPILGAAAPHPNPLPVKRSDGERGRGVAVRANLLCITCSDGATGLRALAGIETCRDA